MRLLLAVGIIASAGVFSLARAQVSQAEPPAEKPFGIEIIRTEVPEAGVFHRPIVSVGTNKFFFTAPRGFRIRADEEQRRVFLEDPEGKCSITLRLRPDLAAAVKPAPASSLASTNTVAPTLHDAFREPLLRQYPNARITEEYQTTAGGVPGATFDFVWLTAAGFPLHTRVCYVPTLAGVFEFVLLVDPKQLAEFHGAFNSVLLTFRLAPPGRKLDLPVIPSKS